MAVSVSGTRPWWPPVCAAVEEEEVWRNYPGVRFLRVVTVETSLLLLVFQAPLVKIPCPRHNLPAHVSSPHNLLVRK